MTSRSTASVVLGVVALVCGSVTVSNTVVWLGGLAALAALVGFLIGYAADTARGAILGQLINFVSLALLIVWVFTVVTQAAT